MLRLIRYLKGYRVQAVLAPLFKFLETATELIMPLIMANLIDKGIASGDTAYIIRQSVYMGALTFGAFFCVMMCQWLASIASIGMGANIRRVLLNKIGRFSYSQLDKFGTHSLTNRATNDVIQVQTAAAMFLRLLMRLPFLLIGGIVMAVIINARMSLVLAVVVPVFVAVMFLIVGRTAPLYRGAQKSLDQMTLVVRENIQGTRVVRAFNKSSDEDAHFSRVNGAYSGIAVKAGRFAALFSPLTALIMNIAVIAVLWLAGGIHSTYFGMTSGQLMAFINYLTQIITALTVAANLSQNFIKAAASARRINEVLDLPEEGGVACTGGVEAPESPGAPAVEFKNAFFSYGGKNVLTDVSFTLPDGGTLGIIGGTGSGKTTLVNLVPGFYGPNEGVVRVLGKRTDEYDAVTLHDLVGVVPQQALLFSGTIADNLRWGKPGADEEDMRAACKTAQALEFVDKLPHKFDTVLTEGGKNLSGGQKQRLTIARALIKKPRILILDDSASALDAKTDARLRKALKRDLKETGVIIVSQRVNAVMDADKIIVLTEGSVAGAGTHKELLTGCPLYKEICESQNAAGGAL